jgi:serine/threonine protein kinase
MAKASDQIGPYTLVSKLGRGAFGVVWLAEKRTAITTTKVAIKIPNDEDVDLEAVKQEASLWVHASGHPNVLPIIDADIHDEQVIIVSEYAPDGSLSKWLERNGGQAPSVESAIETTLGILAGLEHLHKRGIIHRDLKPDNILLQGDTPRLADFGIARILKNTSKSTVATGTPAYMPPEAFDGKRNEQTDIWSVGVIFYQLLTGRLPFPQTDISSLLMAIVTREPEPLPNSIPEQIRRVVEGALKRNPDERCRSAGEMRQALRNIARLREPSQNDIETKVLPPSNVPTEVLPKPEARESSLTIASPTIVSPVPSASTNEPSRMEAALTMPSTLSPNHSEPTIPSSVGSSLSSESVIPETATPKPKRLLFIAIASVLVLGVLIAVTTFYINSTKTAGSENAAASVEDKIKAARALKAQFRIGDPSPENIDKAHKAIDSYKEVLALDPNNDEAFKAGVSLYRSISDDESLQRWVEARTLNESVSPQRRAEAFTFLASRDWSCSNTVTDSSENKQIIDKNGALFIKWRKPKLQSDFDKAQRCTVRGLEEVEKAISLSPEYDVVWDFKQYLLLQYAILAEMEGRTDDSKNYRNQADQALIRYRELAARNNSPEDPEPLIRPITRL